MKKQIPLIFVIITAVLSACTTPVIQQPATAIPIATMQPTAIPPTPTIQPTLIPTPVVSLNSQPLHMYQFKMENEMIGWGLGGLTGENARVLRTEDGGQTWKDLKIPAIEGSEQGSVQLAGYFMNDKLAWVAPYREGMPPLAEQPVFASSDGGATWVRSAIMMDGSLETFSISHIFFVDDKNGWLMAHVGAGMNHDYIVIYRTVDGGTTWESMVDPMKNDAGIQSCQKNGLIFSNPQNGWLTGSCNGVAPGVLFFRTKDAGKTWTPVELPSPQAHPGMYQDPNAVCGSQFPFVDSKVVKVEVVCKLMNASMDQPITVLNTSNDGGVSWNQQDVPGGIMTYQPDNLLLVLGDKRSLSNDSGATWTDLPQAPDSISAQFVSSQIGWLLAATGNTFAQTKDGGASWDSFTPKLIE